MENTLRVSAYDFNNNYASNVISFGARGRKAKDPNAKVASNLPELENATPKASNPVTQMGIPFDVAKKFIEKANLMGLSGADYLKQYMPHLFWDPRIQPEPTTTAIVGKTNVSTLIDGEQIFNKTLEYLNGAKKSIQIEMFEFQNLKVDGDRWPSNGAEAVPGFEQQQQILSTILKKKEENPDMKIQIILDAHKWYMDGHGRSERHYNNLRMIEFLKKKGIDVVPYPRASQQGTALQHVKMLAVDGEKTIIGGMNWGTHSVANHDACLAIEKRAGEENSEVDNIIENIFNKDWKFAWQRLGETKLISGPLTVEEQAQYKGLRKEIKQENVDYMNIVGKLYDNPVDRNRYKEGRLDLIQTNPVENPEIKVMATKPRELAFVGEQGEESTRDYLKDKINTANKIRAELFVLSDKELIENIIRRHKAGELDAKFICHSEILEEFPYCRKAYNKLIQNKVPVRLYNFDERINQRMHAKWAVFNDNELMIGSTNWSSMGLNTNLKTGQREDYDLHAKNIDNQIKDYLKQVREVERELDVPSLKKSEMCKKEFDLRRRKFRKAFAELQKTGSALITLNNKTYGFDDRDASNLSTVAGYYDTIHKCNNAKEKYKRGNNECAIAVSDPKIANTFIKQFDKDWAHSINDYEELREKTLNLLNNAGSLNVVG